jgi:hypothetical protein
MNALMPSLPSVMGAYVRSGNQYDELSLSVMPCSSIVGRQSLTLRFLL